MSPPVVFRPGSSLRYRNSENAKRDMSLSVSFPRCLSTITSCAASGKGRGRSSALTKRLTVAFGACHNLGNKGRFRCHHRARHGHRSNFALSRSWSVLLGVAFSLQQARGTLPYFFFACFCCPTLTLKLAACMFLHAPQSNLFEASAR